jgi:hypothetical protein
MTSGHPYLPKESNFCSTKKFAKGKVTHTPVDWFLPLQNHVERKHFGQ